MAFEATCSVSGRTVLHVRQSGCEHSVRWSRYYDVISTGTDARARQAQEAH